ncbi:MAG: MBL fold metallo-hydrolase [Chloroflexi bacterium]|nr:MBL fold metallo-hydrolase [Chloroflexota bacterium]
MASTRVYRNRPVTLTLGSIRVHVLSDGVVWWDGGGMFGLTPKVLWQRVIRPDELNRVPMMLRTLLVEAGETRILVDTGIGDKLPDKARRQINLQGRDRLLQDLATLGLGPEDIDIVLLTHLHNDHCGGNTRLDEEGRVVPTFPRAEYWIQRRELADAMFPNERTRGTYFRENVEPLMQSGQLRVIDGDTDVVPGIWTTLTPGHTASHQCVVMEGGGEKAIFLADAVSWGVFFERLAWVPAYDLEPMVSIHTKKRLARWALRHNAWLIFQHDARFGVGKLEEQDGHYLVRPLEASRSVVEEVRSND